MKPSECWHYSFDRGEASGFVMYQCRECLGVAVYPADEDKRMADWMTFDRHMTSVRARMSQDMREIEQGSR